MLRDRDQYKRAQRAVKALEERIHAGERDPALLARQEAGAHELVAYEWPEENARPLSRHAALEVDHAVRQGPLGPNDPVPGCCCALCLTLAAGGAWEDAEEAEQAVLVLAGIPPAERIQVAEGWAQERERLGRAVTLPPPGVLAALADLVPGAVREPRSRPAHTRAPIRNRMPKRSRQGRVAARQRRRRQRDLRPALDLDAARAVPIVEVARRLGLGEGLRAGADVLVKCPLHEDRRPSLCLHPGKQVWFCHVCCEGGDGIRLVMRALGVPFVDAVRVLTGTAAPARGALPSRNGAV